MLALFDKGSASLFFLDCSIWRYYSLPVLNEAVLTAPKA